MKLNKYILSTFILFSLTIAPLISQDHSIARDWNEEMLNAIRNDFARPTVHARNLWHTSILMYDIWALVSEGEASTYLIGNTIRDFECPPIDLPEYTESKEEVIRIALSHGMYSLMRYRFRFSPRSVIIQNSINAKMSEEGLNRSYLSQDYRNGNPAALGNYIAQLVIDFGLTDLSRDPIYNNVSYSPVNSPLNMTQSGENDMAFPNRWQPLTLDEIIDQSGNPIPGDTPDFLSPEWGRVTPFSLSDDDKTVYTRNNFEYPVYHDPGPPPLIDLGEKTEMSDEFQWGFAMVTMWGSHLDPSDGVMLDISPGALGNQDEMPQSIAEYRQYYDREEGGDPSQGHEMNPITGQPYNPNVVPRADYARVLAEFWADGPDSETPPGHWFGILNYVNDHPMAERKYKGLNEDLDALEWDVKAYFMMGGAMHDCAITAWGIKGWYDYLRPVSAIRAMASRGQSTNETLPNYDPAGLPLISDYIEIVTSSDPLAGMNGEHIGKIKVFSWRGPNFIQDPTTDVAGVGWILAQDWWPYQRPSFVTPPFAGYISGHSTFSRAAAEVLTYITGDEFFPGGMGEFVAKADTFLVFEKGPSVDVTLQWATYRDASDQTSLSRIWGGIHPPADDIPGRKIGITIAEDVWTLSEEIFYQDADNDGFYSYEDCDDNDSMINPISTEICDGIDNNCSGHIDEDLDLYTYYIDEDGDGYGNRAMPVDTCRANPITGFVANDEDCDDTNPNINPSVSETCDGVDNNCSGEIDENLTLFTYFRDEDQDGFGNLAFRVDTCRVNPIAGYVVNSDDCNDQVAAINPDAIEICDTIDNDCNGRADDGLQTIRYYLDSDLDGFGNASVTLDTCVDVNVVLMAGEEFVTDNTDCDDQANSTNPIGLEIADNDIDEDCSGYDLFEKSKIYPNPSTGYFRVHYNSATPVQIFIYDAIGQRIVDRSEVVMNNFFELDLSFYPVGYYILKIIDEDENELYTESVLKI